MTHTGKQKKRPKPIFVAYVGPHHELLRTDGIISRPEGSYGFSRGIALKITGQPVDALGRYLPNFPEKVGEAVEWDTADIDYFQGKAERNPGTWVLAKGPGPLPIPEPPVDDEEADKPNLKKAKNAKKPEVT